jgi:hypothetical protein
MSIDKFVLSAKAEKFAKEVSRVTPSVSEDEIACARVLEEEIEVKFFIRKSHPLSMEIELGSAEADELFQKANHYEVPPIKVRK